MLIIMYLIDIMHKINNSDHSYEEYFRQNFEFLECCTT
jgi:hypothetical protein